MSAEAAEESVSSDGPRPDVAVAAVDVVLVRPETPGNVGAVARAMRNTGLDRLRLVQPCDFRTVECWRTAWGAHDVLEAVGEYDDLSRAIAGYDSVVAFSGRGGGDPPFLDVRDAARRLGSLDANRRGAFVFGPESTGLAEDELMLCGTRALIPANPAQPSLNLSHAVIVAGYELLRARGTFAPNPELATDREKGLMFALFEEGLRSAGALAEDDTRYAPQWRALLLRADLSRREVRLFEHLAHKLLNAPHRP